MFWVSLTLSLSVLAATLPLGGPELFGSAGAVLLLPHLAIGDLFHWSKFPALDGSTRVGWLSLALLGFVIFLGIRQAGQYAAPLFYLYFFTHFWKDLDIGLGQVEGAELAGGRLRSPKRWCGAILFSAYLVIASGLVREARLIASMKPVVLVMACGLLAFGSIRLLRARASAQPVDVLWGRYLTFSGCFLLLCATFDALHPARSLLPNLLFVWHFMLWYVFYWFLLRRPPATEIAPKPGRGLGRVRHSLAALSILTLLLNGFSVAGAYLYWWNPAWSWLEYLYNYHYVAGCWAIMHITWDWMPKKIRGVRLAVI